MDIDSQTNLFKYLTGQRPNWAPRGYVEINTVPLDPFSQSVFLVGRQWTNGQRKCLREVSTLFTEVEIENYTNDFFWGVEWVGGL